MASLIPALSEKAKLEIRKIIDISLSYFDPSLSMTDFEAFQDLFDLEKYPITREMIFEYLQKSELFEDNIVKGSTIECFEFGSCIYTGLVNNSYSDKLLLDTIYRLSDISLLILIGDIHGWWETPKTY